MAKANLRNRILAVKNAYAEEKRTAEQKRIQEEQERCLKEAQRICDAIPDLVAAALRNKNDYVVLWQTDVADSMSDLSGVPQYILAILKAEGLENQLSILSDEDRERDNELIFIF